MTRLELPFSVRTSPFAEQAEEHVRAWVRRFGLVPDDATARRFDVAEFGHFIAGVVAAHAAVQRPVPRRAGHYAAMR